MSGSLKLKFHTDGFFQQTNPSQELAVGKGTTFKFASIENAEYIIEFLRIKAVPSDERQEQRTSNRQLRFLENSTGHKYTIVPEYLPAPDYHQTGVQFSFGAVTVPFKLMLGDELRLLPGGTGGIYLGPQFLLPNNVAITIGGSLGVSFVSEADSEEAVATVAVIASVRIGGRGQVGLLIGADIAGSLDPSNLEYWISFATGFELFPNT